MGGYAMPIQTVNINKDSEQYWMLYKCQDNLLALKYRVKQVGWHGPCQFYCITTSQWNYLVLRLPIQLLSLPPAPSPFTAPVS